ncbi:MAG: aldehyde dehydrogenase family protein, partial [Acidimicrobiia bacterium]
MFEPYRNEPYTDFTAPAAKVAYELALAGIRGQLGASYGAVIFAEELTGGQEFHSVNPCRPNETIGTVHAVSAEQVDDALAAAWSAFPAWAALGAEGRARAMVRLAAVMRRRKYELAAWETLEA